MTRFKSSFVLQNRLRFSYVLCNSSLQEPRRLRKIRPFNSREEYQSVLKLCDNKRRIDWLESMLIPARTDTFANFCKDLTLPRFFDEALKTKELVEKILISLGTILWGVITFPIRCITAIPWVIYSRTHTKEAHPFYQYLIKNGVAPADLSKDHIYLKTKEIVAPDPHVDRYLVTTRGDTFNFRRMLDSVSAVRGLYSTSIMSQKELASVL